MHKLIEVDVLVAGGSGAGVSAAVQAAQQGLRVALVSKGKVGRSGNVIMAGGGFTIDGESGAQYLHDSYADTSFTREKLFDCLVKESYYIADQNMVTQYVEEAPAAIAQYLAWAEHTRGIEFLRAKPCGWMSSGLHFAKVLAQGLKEHPEISVLEDVQLLDVLVQDNAVCGAIGLDVYAGAFIEFRAKAVILATGGYQPFSMKNTVSDMTGDGAAMAYRAGATLTDMEFMLAFPTAVWPQDMKGSIYPFIFEFFMPSLRYRVIDKNGNPLPIPEEIASLTRGTKLSKLASSYYMGMAIDQGLGGPNGGVYYDYSSFTKEEKDAAFAAFHDRFNRFHAAGCYKGESLDRIKEKIYAGEPIEIGLGFEYCMGGIQVDAQMQTGVNGLFAAGEVTSGVFGACRAGDGLTEMLAQGYRAGLSAAGYCRGLGEPPAAASAYRTLEEHYLHYFDNQGGRSPIELYNQMEQACDAGFSVIRCEQGLSSTLQTLQQLKKELPIATLQCKSRAYNFEWIRAIQAENMLICCEAGVQAALDRKESRGCHIRKDYPQVDHDAYLHKYCFTKGPEAMQMYTRMPVVTSIPLPAGTRANVIDYFLDKSLHYSR